MNVPGGKKALVIFCLSLIISIDGYCQKTTFNSKQGSEAANQIATRVRVDSSSIPAKYINAVGLNLAKNLENRLFDYRFYIIDIPEPNAFALPGGYIYLTRGILPLLNSEDELAGIIGHEIIHINNRHSYKIAKKNILPAILKAPGNVVGLVNEDLGKLINSPIEITNSIRLAKYGRKQETEADTYGIRLMARSGYQPLALAEALENLKSDIEYLTGKEEKFNFFDDHPLTPDRIENIVSNAGNLVINDQPAVVPSRQDFLMRMEGVYLGEHPSQGIFYKNRFLHADLDLDISFPEGWATTNRSTYISADQPEKKASVYMFLAGGNKEPKEYGKSFIDKFRTQNRVESYRAEELEINGNPAFIFGVDELSSRQLTNSTMIWIRKDGITFQILGAGLKKYEKDFENVARSIKPLTEETRQKITGVVLMTVEAMGGETISELGKRTGNALKEEYTILINDIDRGTKFKEGHLIKIGVIRQYNPESHSTND